MDNLCYLSIADASRRIARGDLDPVELTQQHLKRIAAVDPGLHSYITVSSEVALENARGASQSRKGRKRSGRLFGIPISYKDLIATAGIRTTGASRVFAEWIPEKNAAVVANLRRDGAVTLGKATLNEFAFSTAAESDFIKPARNPWNPAASPGLSSSGSAVAVAAGLAMASIGTDSGGSIRIPSSYCGVTGIKPTYGLVGRSGVLALSYSCDHVGVLARSSEDTAIVLTSLAGYDPDDPGSRRRPEADYLAGINAPVQRLRLGVMPKYMEATGLERDVADTFYAAVKVLQSLGANVQEVEIPYLAYGPAADFTILRVEGFNIHLKNLREKRALYGRTAFQNIASGGYLSTADYYAALQARTLLAGEVNRVLRSVDVLVMPTTPRSALPGEDLKPGTDSKVAGSSVAYLAPFNLTGHPALSIPCGFTRKGMPTGLQFVGRAFDEATLLRLAHAYQKQTDWHARRPILPRTGRI